MSNTFFIFLSSPSPAFSSNPSFRRAASSRRVLGSGRERESTRTSLPREGGREEGREGGREGCWIRERQRLDDLQDFV